MEGMMEEMRDEMVEEMRDEMVEENRRIRELNGGKEHI